MDVVFAERDRTCDQSYGRYSCSLRLVPSNLTWGECSYSARIAASKRYAVQCKSTTENPACLLFSLTVSPVGYQTSVEMRGRWRWEHTGIRQES